MTLQMSEIKPDQSIVGQEKASSSAASNADSLYALYGKRVLDCLLIVVSSPLVVVAIILMAIVVATDGKNPFYSQLRIGRGGKHFRLWKMRTMTSDADARLAAFLASDPAAKAEWDHHQKLKHDPRITRVGHILRKTSLDELPQLLNVLTGAMSLVGPRPMMVDQDDLYHGKAYYDLRPGITGLWQTSDRNASSFAARVAYDDAYGRTVSLKTDIVTLWRTIAVVFRGTGY